MTEHRNYEEVLAERARYPLGKPTPYRPGHKNYLEDNNSIGTRETHEGHRRSRWSARRTAWVMFTLIFIGVGFLLLMHFSELFVFHYAEPYRNLVILITVVLAPFVFYRLSHSTFADELAKKHPTAWIRKGISLPVMAVLAVVLPLVAPLGWLFAGVAWSNDVTQRVQAMAIEVRPYSKGKGCDQFATLRLLSIEKETCLDYRYPRSAMRRGQHLSVGIRTVPFGFLIVSIEDASPDAPDSPVEVIRTSERP